MIKKLIDRLNSEGRLSKGEFDVLLREMSGEDAFYLRMLARKKSVEVFGKEVKMRGLIEISNICRRNCLYCGIRKGNSNVERYRLSKEEIVECCAEGSELGFKTFVMQGGEDPMHSREWIADVVATVKGMYPDIVVTLSLGERSKEDYQAWRDAGAERYLLRHETIDAEHYARLHPSEMRIGSRVQCLRDLKEVGFETGTGIMVGSPYQTIDNVVDDVMFIQDFEPEMIGIGPFLHHKDTPFRGMPNGDVELTLNLLAIFRLMHPQANIPSTTSLGTISTDGRERGILAGANVVMPNLSPQKDRRKYSLYDNKICTNEEAAEGLDLLRERMEGIGYTLD